MELTVRKKVLRKIKSNITGKKKPLKFCYSGFQNMILQIQADKGTYVKLLEERKLRYSMY